MRVFYTVFFFLSALLCLPVDSKAAIPAEVIKVGVSVTGAAVTVSGVSAIIPSSAVAGVPSVGTASASTGVVTVPAIIPVTVGGIALAGGYAVGASLVTDIPALRNLVESLPDKYQALKDSFATPPPATVEALPVGSVTSFDGQNLQIDGIISNTEWCPTYRLINDGTACEKLQDTYSAETSTLQIFTGAVRPWILIYRVSPTLTPVTPVPGTTPLTDPELANKLAPDGNLTSAADADIKAAIAAGDLVPSGIVGGFPSAGGEAGSVTGITPELMQLYSRMLAAQNATDVATQTVEQLEDALATDPANATLAQQLDQAKLDQAEAQREQAAAEAAAAEATAAADTATANLGPANTYDSTINTPDQKNITGLMNTFFDNSPLLGIVRSFQINTTDQQALFSFGTFWGQEITVDFTRWQSVLAGCGVVLLVLSHAYAVFIVVRG